MPKYKITIAGPTVSDYNDGEKIVEATVAVPDETSTDQVASIAAATVGAFSDAISRLIERTAKRDIVTGELRKLFAAGPTDVINPVDQDLVAMVTEDRDAIDAEVDAEVAEAATVGESEPADG